MQEETRAGRASWPAGRFVPNPVGTKGGMAMEGTSRTHQDRPGPVGGPTPEQSLADPAPRLARRLRDEGLRLTPQRLAVYRCLQEFAARHHHPTVEEVHQALAGVLPLASAATVRRTLDLLVELGLARRVTLPGEAEHFDGDPHLHVHVHCRQCGRVEDLPFPQLERLEEEVVSRTGFVVTGQSLVFTGLCPDCQRAKGDLARIGGHLARAGAPARRKPPETA